MDLNALKVEVYQERTEVMRRTGGTQKMNQTHFSDPFAQSLYGSKPQSDHGWTKVGFNKTDFDALTADQLKERLMVAETIMKRLYNRNKELETYHSQINQVNQIEGQKSERSHLPSHDKSDELALMFTEFKNRESGLERELRDREDAILRLEAEIQRLAKSA